MIMKKTMMIAVLILVAAGATVASFNVIWPTSAELVQAVYEARVTLTATAL